jgi:flagellar biosynthetic protein FlhB
MAEGGDSQEKTEEPTQKRRDDARRDGQVVTSQEVFVFSTFALGLGLVFAAGLFLPEVIGHWAQGFRFDSRSLGSAFLLEKSVDLFEWLFLSGILIGIPMMIVILVSQAAMGGINFAPKALGFKGSKIDPLAGLKRMVSAQAGMNLVKSILKVGLLLGAGGVVLWWFMPMLTGTAALAVGDSISMLATASKQVFAAILIGLLVIGGIDLGYQMHSNKQKLMMSRQEIKDEMKESEGSPEIKSQIRRRQIEASRRAAERKALDDVPTANAIITNPTHFAVALRYDPQESDAPVIVAMGRGPMAKEVMKRGKKAGVVILNVPPLARALFYTGAIGERISEQLFVAVAAILAHVWRLEKGQIDPMPDIDVPQDVLFDAYGRKLKKGKKL